MASQGVIVMINDNTIENAKKPSPEKEEAKASCYEESIWDDWNDREVDEVYGEMYRQLR